MTRRQALLAIMAAPMADVRVLAQAGPANPTGLVATKARLTIPLDQWGVLAFTHKGKEILLTPAQIFAALAKGD